MHVYTMGNRKYADTILNLIDPDKKYFDNRIISRDENNNALQKSLDRISTEHRNIVILDDRGDVWKFCKNLINIKPYYFFVEGDINNPFKSKKQILNTNETVECIYDNFNDNELLFVKNILERVYSEYFTKQKNTRKILSKLRNIIFKDLNFYVDKQNKSFIDRKYIKKIIKNCGGTLNKHYKFDYIIATNDLNIDNNYFKVSKFKCNIISYKYIIECFYSFKRLDPKEFIIFDYENKLIEDLEDEFNL
ncbi:CTD phosphatase Fcp1 [Gurleya vavrai]